MQSMSQRDITGVKELAFREANPEHKAGSQPRTLPDMTQNSTHTPKMERIGSGEIEQKSLPCTSQPWFNYI